MSASLETYFVHGEGVLVRDPEGISGVQVHQERFAPYGITPETKVEAVYKRTNGSTMVVFRKWRIVVWMLSLSPLATHLEVRLEKGVPVRLSWDALPEALPRYNREDVILCPARA